SWCGEVFTFVLPLLLFFSFCRVVGPLRGGFCSRHCRAGRSHLKAWYRAEFLSTLPGNTLPDTFVCIHHDTLISSNANRARPDIFVLALDRYLICSGRNY